MNKEAQLEQVSTWALYGKAVRQYIAERNLQDAQMAAAWLHINTDHPKYIVIRCKKLSWRAVSQQVGIVSRRLAEFVSGMFSQSQGRTYPSDENNAGKNDGEAL